MLVVEIYEFIKGVLNVFGNHYVFSYVIFPGLIACGIIKVHRKDNEPYMKSTATYLLIYYFVRTVYDIYIK